MNDERSGRLRAFRDGELHGAERQALEHELAASPEARAELAELEALDAELHDLLDLEVREPDAAQAWRSLARRLQPPIVRRRWPRLLAASSVLAVALVLVLWWSGGPTHGSLVAESRSTVAIGTRATAVAEAGSALAWDVDAHGDAYVRQSAGAVFYRVDGGDAFVVDTPAGRVTVTGTCFTVELLPMRPELKHLASATGGAVLASALLLTVHEGHVVLADDRGDVEVVAGQSARTRAGGAPTIDDDPSAPSRGAPEAVAAGASSGSAAPSRFAALVRENAEQRRELRRLQAELSSRDGPKNVAAIDRDSPEYRRAAARECGAGGECGASLWTDPTEEELVELAKCGRLLVDTPPIMYGLDTFPRGSLIEAAGLSEAEALRYEQTATAFQAEAGRELKSYANELGVPAELTERLSIAQLFGLVEAVVDDDTAASTRRQIANERAGIGEAPPADQQSPGERALRYQIGLGDAFERRLGAELGTDAARELRRADGGWGSKQSIGDGECRP